MLLINLGEENFDVKCGTPIAQLVCHSIRFPALVSSENQDDWEFSQRGEKAFGSGVNSTKKVE